MKRFISFLSVFTLCMMLCAAEDERDSDKNGIYLKAHRAVVNIPNETVDWWANIVDFYRSDDPGKVVLVGPGNLCTRGPKVVKKTVNDNEIEFSTKAMGYKNHEVHSVIIVDKNDNYVAHIPYKKKLEIGDELKLKFRFAKPTVPTDLMSAKYRCIGGVDKPVEGTYSK